MRLSTLVVAAFLVSACASAAAEEDPAATWRERTRAGMSAFSAARYPEARDEFEAALAIAETFPGGDPRLGTSLNNLAGTLEAQGLYDRAESLYRRSLAVKEAELGPDHLGVSVGLNNLALLYDQQGRYEESITLYRRALAIREKGLGPRDPAVALILNNLGVVETHRGRYEEAERNLRRALAIREGTGDPALAETLTNLGNLERARGRTGEARALLERALRIREDALGDRHPEVASTLNGLAATWRAEGRLEKAEPLYERALAIREEALGEGHPDVATSLNNLALVYRSLGEPARARELYERALRIWESAVGPEHPDVAAVLNNLAALHRAEGRLDEAESLLERSVAVSEKTLGPDHPELAVRLRNLAEVQIANDRAERARPVLERARSIARGAFRQGHPQRAQIERDLERLVALPPAAAPDSTVRVAASRRPAESPRERAEKLAALVEAFEGEGRYAESAALRRELLSLREEALGANSPELIPILTALAGDTLALGHYAEAEEALQRAYALTVDPAVQLAILDRLSSAYRVRGRYVEAESACRDAIRISEEIGTDATSGHLERLGRLGFLLVDRGDYEAAEEVYLEAMDRADSLEPVAERSGALEGYARLLWKTGRTEEARTIDARVLDRSSAGRWSNTPRGATGEHPHGGIPSAPVAQVDRAQDS